MESLHKQRSEVRLNKEASVNDSTPTSSWRDEEVKASPSAVQVQTRESQSSSEVMTLNSQTQSVSSTVGLDALVQDSTPPCATTTAGKVVEVAQLGGVFSHLRIPDSVAEHPSGLIPCRWCKRLEGLPADCCRLCGLPLGNFKTHCDACHHYNQCIRCLDNDCNWCNLTFVDEKHYTNEKMLVDTEWCMEANKNLIEQTGIVCPIPTESFEVNLWDVLTDNLDSEWGRVPALFKYHFLGCFYVKNWDHPSLDNGGREVLGYYRDFPLRMYSTRPMAQMGVLNSLVDKAKVFFESIVTYLTDVSKSAVQCSRQIFDSMCDAVRNSLTDPVKWFQNTLSDMIGNMITRCLDHSAAVINLMAPMVKTWVRVMLGYSMNQILVELAFDPFAWKSIGGLITMVQNQVLPQSSGSPLALLAALIISGISSQFKINTNSFANFSKIHHAISPFVDADYTTFLASVPFLEDWFADDLENSMKREYPGHFGLMDYNVKMADVKTKPTLRDIRVAKRLWKEVLDEKRTMRPEHSAYFMRKRDVLFKPAVVADGVASQRAQPPLIVLYGTFGAGKTVLTKKLMRAILRYGKKKKIFPKDLSFDDFYYNHTGQTAHFDGYQQQEIIWFDDFLTRPETPEMSAAAILMGLCNSAPFIPPMADLLNKGMPAEPYCIFVTTNQPWADWPHLCQKSCNNTKGLYRRVSLYVEVKPKHVDEKNVIVVHPEDGIEQYDLLWTPYHGAEPEEISVQDLIVGVCRLLDEYVAAEKFGVEEDEGFADVIDALIEEDAEEDLEAMLQDPELLHDFHRGRPLGSGISSDSDEEILGQGDDFEKNGFSDCRKIFPRLRVNARMAKFEMDGHATGRPIEPSHDEDWERESSLEKLKNGLRTVYDVFTPPTPLSPLDIYQEIDFAAADPYTENPVISVGEVECDLNAPWDLKALALSELEWPYPYLDRDAFAQFDFQINKAYIAYKEEVITEKHQAWENKKLLAKVSAATLLLTGLVAFACSRMKVVDRVKNVVSVGAETLSDVTTEFVNRGKKFVLCEREHKGKFFRMFVEEGVDPQGVPVSVILKKQEKLEKADRDEILFGKRQWLSITPRIQENIITLHKERDTKKVSYALAISAQEFVAAAHVVKNLRTSGGFYVHASNFWYPIRGDDEVRVVYSSEYDIAYVKIFNHAMQRKVDILNKFMYDVEPSVLARLEPKIVSETCDVSKEESIFYGGISGKGVRVDVENQAGDCGLPYVVPGAKDGDIIYGIHVAGSVRSSFANKVSQKWLHECRTQCGGTLADFASGPVPQGAEFFAERGIQVEGSIEPYLRVARKSHKVRHNLLDIPPVSECHCDYEMAQLDARVVANEVVFPENVRLTKWGTSILRRQNVRYKVEDDVLDQVAEILRPCAGFDKVLSYNEVITSCPEEFRKPMPRSTSTGPRLRDLKVLLCEVSCEQPVLKPFVLSDLARYEDILADGGSLPFVNGVSLKDEPLPIKKVEKMETRIFTADDVYRYLMCKKYFGSIVERATRNGVDIGLMFAMDPERLGEAFAEFESMFVIGSDVSGQDLSHTFDAWIEFFSIMLKAGWFDNSTGRKIFVHPRLPALNRVNRIRFGLLRDLAFAYYQLKEFLLRVPGALGSGCFLTLLLNSISNLKVFVVFMILASKLLNRKLEINKDCAVALFGDDANTFVSKGLTSKLDVCSLQLEAAARCGYKLTAPDKSENLKVVEIHEADFCGRVFTRHPIYGPTMKLANERMMKSILFVKIGEFESNFPDQVLGFLREISRHDRRTFNIMLQCLRWKQNGPEYGSALTDYVDIEYEKTCKEFKSKTFDSTEFLKIVRKWMNSRVHVVDVDEEIFGQGDLDEGEPDPCEDAGPLPQMTDEVEKADSESMAHMMQANAVDTSHVDADADFYAFFPEANNLLTRPIELPTVNWSSADIESTLLYEFPALSTFFNNNAEGEMKLAQLVGVHCKICFGVVMITQPFQQGMLGIWGSPMAEIPVSRFGVMSGPHAQVRVGSNTTASLCVDYNRDLNWAMSNSYKSDGSTYPTNREWFDCVAFGMTVLSRLKAGAGTDCKIVPWLWLEQVSVMRGGLTDFLISPQGRGIKSTVSEAAQRTVGMTERVMKGFETVKGVVETVAEVAEVVAESGALLALGLDKPILGNNMTFVRDTQGWYMPNGADGVDTNLFMGHPADGRIIVPRSYYSDDIDQMDIAYQASMYSLLDHFYYDVGDTGLLFYCNANPGNCRIVGGDDCHPTRLTYLSSMFFYWRGDYKLRFTAIKSAFQTGILEISVTYGSNINPVNSANRAARVYKVEWNLSQTNALEVLIPYVWPTNVYPVKFGAVNDPAGLGALDQFTTVFVRALTPLVVSEQASADVEILVEHAMENAQFFHPFMWSPEYDDSPAANFRLPVFDMQTGRDEFHPQGWNFGVIGGSDSGPWDTNRGTTTEAFQKVVLGPGVTKPHRGVVNTFNFCGEAIVNLRSLFSRYYKVGSIDTQGEGTWFELFNHNNTTHIPSYFRYAQRMFVHQAGGYSIKALGWRGNESPINVIQTLDPTIAPNFSPNKAEAAFPMHRDGFENRAELDLIEIDSPNDTMFPYFLIRNTRRSGNRVMVSEGPDSHRYELWVKPVDSFSLFGINYLPNTRYVTRAEIFNPLQFAGELPLTPEPPPLPLKFKAKEKEKEKEKKPRERMIRLIR